MSSADSLLLTAAEYARCRAELDELRRLRDHELPALLRDARALLGDDATEERAQIDEDDVVVRARIALLQRLLDDATVVPDGPAQDDVVTLGREVEVRYLSSGRTTSFVLAGTAASGAPRTVSARSPVGQALMGRSTGEVVTAELPGGRVEQLLVLSVSGGLSRP